jgi:hypothetical protein
MCSFFSYDLSQKMMLRYDVDDDITDEVRWKGCFEVVCCCLGGLLLLLDLFVDSLSRKNESKSFRIFVTIDGSTLRSEPYPHMPHRVYT